MDNRDLLDGWTQRVAVYPPYPSSPTRLRRQVLGGYLRFRTRKEGEIEKFDKGDLIAPSPQQTPRNPPKLYRVASPHRTCFYIHRDFLL